MKRVVFMGTPEFAVGILQQLLDEKDIEVVGVVSQPDKKVGRKQIITFTDVKQAAVDQGIEVFQPLKIREDYQQVMDWNPDLIVTCAYGQLIPQELLEYPKYGSINVHASLLPKLRGGAPIHKAIIYGEKETGVSIMRMVQKMDAGAYMLQYKVEIDKDDTTEVLHDKLVECGKNALHDALPKLFDGTAIFVEQDEDQATYAFNVSKEEEKIHPEEDVNKVYDHIRGLISWPVGYVLMNGKKIKIHEARLGSYSTNHPVGTLFNDKKQLFLQCSNGTIQILKVQLEGKSKCSAVEFINGAGRKYLETYICE